MKTVIKHGQRFVQGSPRKTRQASIHRYLGNAQRIARLGLRVRCPCQPGKVAHALRGRMPICATDRKGRLLPATLELDARERICRIVKVVGCHVA